MPKSCLADLEKVCGHGQDKKWCLPLHNLCFETLPATALLLRQGHPSVDEPRGVTNGAVSTLFELVRNSGHAARSDVMAESTHDISSIVMCCRQYPHQFLSRVAIGAGVAICQVMGSIRREHRHNLLVAPHAHLVSSALVRDRQIDYCIVSVACRTRLPPGGLVRDRCRRNWRDFVAQATHLIGSV